MMQIVYFSRKEEFLTGLEAESGELVFITPSPSKADGLRNRLSSTISHDVITISKFTSRVIQELIPQGLDLKRKSELLLVFGILKNKYLPELGYEQFTQAYNLFSDLRSFTLDADALTTVLDEQPEIIKTAVRLFWKLLDLTGYVDEHGAYHRIAEALRSGEENETLNRTYVFWGFQHLNGQQVDLLKALAIRYRVVIPFPLELKASLKRTDWITWLRDARVTEKELPAEKLSAKAKWIPTNSRELSVRLKEILSTGDQVVLGVSKLSPLHLDIVPSASIGFKIPLQLLNSELSKMREQLRNFSGSSQDLKLELEAKLTPKKNPKELRTIGLYLEVLRQLEELTDEEIKVDGFFLKLLHEVVSLNQPRTSYTPLSSESFTQDLYDMSSLDELKHDRRVVICVDERFEEVQSLGQNYPEVIQKNLAALGPLKRNELDFLYRQWEFRNTFSQGEVLVLMSEGCLKHSLIWKRLFTEIELENQEHGKLSRTHGAVKDHFKDLVLKKFEGRFSASKIQSFLDCPRRFYFSHVDKIFPELVLEKDFDPMTSGTIIHEIIEKFHKGQCHEADLKALTKSVMDHHIQLKNLALPRETYLQRELIFNHRSLNGIRFIRRLEEVLGKTIAWKIEEAFSLQGENELSGRIDCLGVSDEHIFLLDFKSSVFAASTNAEVAEYESIQLWTYARAAETLLPDFQTKNVVLGYVVLDDPESSVLHSSDEDFLGKIKAAKFCKSNRFKEPFEQKYKEATLKIMTTMETIKAESSFAALPRKVSHCTYCDLNKVCVKGGLDV
jgi:CRISPR/Cas system-associated exonuclease Cas4 (RecB family)